MSAVLILSVDDCGNCILLFYLVEAKCRDFEKLCLCEILARFFKILEI